LHVNREVGECCSNAAAMEKREVDVKEEPGRREKEISRKPAATQ